MRYKGALHIPATPSDAAETTLLVDSDAWCTWLSTATKFSVYDSAGNFSVLKTERQRGGLYRTVRHCYQGRLVQVHSGPADALTAVQVAAVPARLAARFTTMGSAATSIVRHA